MTLSFDIIAGNNANWGFDTFSFAPELSTVPTTPSVAQENFWTAAAATTATTTAAAAAALSHDFGASQQRIAGPTLAGTGIGSGSGGNSSCENEVNISPMKNDALCVNMLASDPAARAFDSNLYVASLPDWFTDADLYELFQRFGPILSAKVMCHKGTHHCKGYGFVLFQRTDDAAVARSEMIGHVVGGNKIQVRRARSAASAPLGDCNNSNGGCAAGCGGGAAAAVETLPSTGALNVSPHFMPAAAAATPQPFHSFYPLTSTYVVRNGSNGGNNNSNNVGGGVMNYGKPAMLVAIPNGRGCVVQGPDNVMYMVLPSPQLSSSNVIY